MRSGFLLPPLRLMLCVLAGAASAAAQSAPTAVDLANLREDINGLNQRLAELSLRVEQLEDHPAPAAPKPVRDAVTAAQLNEAVAALSAQIAEVREAARAAAPETHTAPQKSFSAKPAGTGTPASASFPHEGIVYVVQKGDTLALIAKKTGGKFQDIVNANQLTDPSVIRVGQKLFIPGGK